MSLTEQLHAHKGGLLCLKSKLYWYGSRGWDDFPGRVCIVLDVSEVTMRNRMASKAATQAALNSMMKSTERTSLAVVQLLIDGMAHWVWTSQEDVQFL